MKILFFNPPFKGRFSRTSRSPAVTKGGTLYYPIWLAYAAGVSEEAGHEVRLIDAPASGLSLSAITSMVETFTPELIVIDTSTPSIYNDVRIADELKHCFPESFIVLVGTHPSALPDDTLQISQYVDAVAMGEYDYTICHLANNLERKMPIEDVNGLVFRRGVEIVHNLLRSRIKNLDELPFVSKIYNKYLNPKAYFFAAANYPMVMIMTGRGCPHKCFFCVYPQVFHGRYYRVRSVKNVVDEFEYIINNMPGIREIGIEDDCFTANPNRAMEICNLIIERNLQIKWYCNVRGDVDYKLLKRMKQAGCRLVTVGFESGCQPVLDGMNKGEHVERYYQFAVDARRAGLLVHGCIMTGNPGDTRETLEKSYAFAKKINCDSMQFYPLYVYPGTEAYEWAKKNGYLKTEDFSRWLTDEGLHNCVLNTPELSSEDMVSLCDYYLRKYHLRPKYIYQKLLQLMFSPSEGYRSLKSGWAFFQKIISGQLGNSK
ncbi:B12-binding domain-containing radical SAM protein [Desulfobacula phenolica]|uniref:Radical SAM superfamily enzyme YgiQ, UPF0313 family n=1 Tax=Desulfobacula phenolica TaxID=90732 RepID=A0A1H2DSY8_9BACT|nr:radical SAM protein [Desulfobacula phenolica]SDT85538.1 Radical SAM superfamily enzyme YgiQ, UPF0313 family [Desulfobacula phenolica]